MFVGRQTLDHRRILGLPYHQRKKMVWLLGDSFLSEGILYGGDDTPRPFRLEARPERNYADFKNTPGLIRRHHVLCLASRVSPCGSRSGPWFWTLPFQRYNLVVAVLG